jgi:hypothetical protein
MHMHGHACDEACTDAAAQVSGGASRVSESELQTGMEIPVHAQLHNHRAQQRTLDRAYVYHQTCRPLLQQM